MVDNHRVLVCVSLQLVAKSLLTVHLVLDKLRFVAPLQRLCLFLLPRCEMSNVQPQKKPILNKNHEELVEHLNKMSSMTAAVKSARPDKMHRNSAE